MSNIRGKYLANDNNIKFNMLVECLSTKYKGVEIADFIYEPHSTFSKTKLGYYEAKPYQINLLKNVLKTVVSGRKPFKKPRPRLKQA